MEIIQDIIEVFKLSLIKTKDVNLTVGAVVALVVAFVVTSFVLKMVRKIITRKLPLEDKNKFISIFQFIQYLVYLFVIMFTLNASGVNISVLLTASAAIFLGLGFALQQLFQDLISGILIILDQSLHVGDIIEIDDKVCRVEKISLRSTKAITRNQRVMVIPNHKFLSDILFNWTQNSTVIRESVTVGVAYGSDTALVKEVLIQCAKKSNSILKTYEPIVMFENFGDSSLDFILYFFVDDAFASPNVKSDLRFEIDKQFRANNISIPFPQRDVHLISKTNIE
ncbi:MAG: mechanosensitive ion channel [Flavobacterium sp.]|uniref:mechanosensitive ion channel family protein n=1 Tax=Flavobacterium sp. TaxID=239 RepID=UPI001DC55463|nr:mechanosensitive ion channel [Flavobacterium sp.]